MPNDIRRLLAERDFEPFSIVSSSGQRYKVASREHASVNPSGSRMVIWFDDDSGVTLSALHIAALETEKSAPPAAA